MLSPPSTPLITPPLVVPVIPELYITIPSGSGVGVCVGIGDGVGVGVKVGSGVGVGAAVGVGDGVAGSSTSVGSVVGIGVGADVGGTRVSVGLVVAIGIGVDEVEHPAQQTVNARAKSPPIKYHFVSLLSDVIL